MKWIYILCFITVLIVENEAKYSKIVCNKGTHTAYISRFSGVEIINNRNYKVKCLVSLIIPEGYGFEIYCPKLNLKEDKKDCLEISEKRTLGNLGKISGSKNGYHLTQKGQEKKRYVLKLKLKKSEGYEDALKCRITSLKGKGMNHNKKKMMNNYKKKMMNNHKKMNNNNKKMTSNYMKMTSNYMKMTTNDMKMMSSTTITSTTTTITTTTSTTTTTTTTSTTTTTRSGCSFSINNKCFLFAMEMKNADSMKTYCQGLNGDLISQSDWSDSSIRNGLTPVIASLNWTFLRGKNGAGKCAWAYKGSPTLHFSDCSGVTYTTCELF